MARSRDAVARHEPARVATKATRSKSNTGSAEPVTPASDPASLPNNLEGAQKSSSSADEKKGRTRSNLIGGRGYRATGGSEKVASARSVAEADAAQADSSIDESDSEQARSEKGSRASAASDPPVSMASLRPLRLDIQQLRQRSEQSAEQIQGLTDQLGRIDELETRLLRQEALADELDKTARFGELEARLAKQEALLEQLISAQAAAPPPEPAEQPSDFLLSGPAGLEAETWVQRCVELEQQLYSLTQVLEQKEQELLDYAETVKSRDDELGELSLFADDMERKHGELKALFDAQSQNRVQEQLLREEVARLQNQLAEKARQVNEAQTALQQAQSELASLRANAQPNSRTVADLSRRLALAHGLLDELDVLMFSVAPEPPSLIAPFKRLRKRLKDLRGASPFFRNPLDGQMSDAEERILNGNEELVLIRQRLLEAHNLLERTERERDLAVSRLKEMVRESGSRLR
jgi:chromosome segregation ATPase